MSGYIIDIKLTPAEVARLSYILKKELDSYNEEAIKCHGEISFSILMSKIKYTVLTKQN